MVDYYYLVSDYYATGEGSTKCILISRGFGRAKDPKENTVIHFTEAFGSYFATGAEFVEHDEFWDKYEKYVPEFVKRVVNEKEDPPRNFFFTQQVHLNFS